MKKIISVIFVFVFSITIGYCQEKEKQELPDYKALAEQCKEKTSVGCCMASVRAMEEGKYLLDTGKTFKDTTCPKGYEPNMMRCIDSYRWCVPVKNEKSSNH